MFRQKVRRENVVQQRVAQQRTREITQLKTRQAELEQTLRQVIEASDDLVVDLNRSQHELKIAQARSGFAEAWSRSDAPNAEFEEFFAVSEIDRRARRWLLASN